MPDISGTTRRYDVNATAVWRKDAGRGYLEAGFGRTTLGVAFQHLSNAGIEQPNGGIDFVQLTVGYAL